LIHKENEYRKKLMLASKEARVAEKVGRSPSIINLMKRPWKRNLVRPNL
jgi:hypothetical protein